MRTTSFSRGNGDDCRTKEALLRRCGHDLYPALAALPNRIQERAPAPSALRPNDPDQTPSLDCRRNWRMARRLSIIDVAAIAIIVLSLSVLVFVGFSIWAEP
jgi:hypothetical protein